ncbi:MAG: hypothetical protein QME79_15080 [Bacillota bacterium]|nr:hypothetical protein [Bacillota bacterium]
MSRKRSITSDISISPDVAAVAEENPIAGLMWPWFCTAVDDWCRMEADPRKVKLTVFQAFPFKAAEIQAAMEAYSRHGLAYLYVVDGRQYLMVNPETFYRLNTYVPNWKQVIDASPMPPPSDHPWGKYWKVRDTEATTDELRRKYADELRPSTTVVDERSAAPTVVPSPSPSPSPSPKEHGRTEDAHAPARKAEESSDVSGAYPTEELVLAPDVTPTERELLAVLTTIPGYPFDYTVALRKIREWAVDFPSLDLVREAKKWSDWLSNPRNKVKNHHLAFRNWLEREMNTRTRGTGPPQQPQARAEPKAWATLRRMMAEEMRKEAAAPDDPG